MRSSPRAAGEPMLSLALVTLVAIVALARGGYAPSGSLVLELGAALMIVGAVVRVLWVSTPEREKRWHAWRRMPFHVRYPTLARWLRMGKTMRADVEIWLPGESEEERIELDVGRNAYPFGVAVKRTGLGVPLVLLTIWIASSAAPVPISVLEVLSPSAFRYRTEASVLVGDDGVDAAPWSLAPFLTLSSAWLWLAVASCFVLSVAAFRRRDAAAHAALALLVVGALSGVYGLAEWASGLSGLWGRNPVALRASGSFGNPNHYAAFQAMLVSVSIGWLAFFRTRHRPRSRRGRRDSRAMGLAAIAGLSIALSCLGLVLSLSRSGIVFAVAGVAAWVLLTRRTGERRALAALVLVAVGLVVWVGLEPLVGRFQNLEEQWLLEQGRTAVWSDSVPAIGDFWLTGSGLSSFRYVGPAYRTFGGRIFYSWAHNDYLQLAVELGVPGVLLLVWIVVAVVRGIRRVREDVAGDAAIVQLHAGFVAALVAIACHSFTDFSLHMPANLALVAVLTGAALGLEKDGFRRTSP